MIPPLSIYQQNYGQLYNDNAPVQYKLPKFTAFAAWILTPLQWLWGLLFNSGYSDGSTAANWVSGNPYIYGNRVVDTDYAVYEVMNVAGVTSTTHPKNDPVNWFKVLDTFIGARERAYYTGSKIYLEFILNRQFQVAPTALPFAGASHTTQIWISPSTNSLSNFWLSNAGPASLTAYLANNATFATQFLGNSYNAYSPYSFTINVPTAVYATIGANPPPGVTADQAITNLVQKYCQCNLLFNIITY